MATFQKSVAVALGSLAGATAELNLAEASFPDGQEAQRSAQVESPEKKQKDKNQTGNDTPKTKQADRESETEKVKPRVRRSVRFLMPSFEEQPYLKGHRLIGAKSDGPRIVGDYGPVVRNPQDVHRFELNGEMNILFFDARDRRAAQVARRLVDLDIPVVGVTRNSEKEVRRFFKAADIAFPVVVGSRSARDFRVRHRPCTVVHMRLEDGSDERSGYVPEVVDYAPPKQEQTADTGAETGTDAEAGPDYELFDIDPDYELTHADLSQMAKSLLKEVKPAEGELLEELPDGFLDRVNLFYHQPINLDSLPDKGMVSFGKDIGHAIMYDMLVGDLSTSLSDESRYELKVNFTQWIEARAENGSTERTRKYMWLSAGHCFGPEDTEPVRLMEEALIDPDYSQEEKEGIQKALDAIRARE